MSVKKSVNGGKFGLKSESDVVVYTGIERKIGIQRPRKRLKKSMSAANVSQWLVLKMRVTALEPRN